VTEALRGLRESRVDLPQELTPRRFDGDPERAQPAPVEAEPEPEPEPEPEAEAEIADPEIEPSPELSEMFREQITRMRDDGKPRDEAERVLLRFRLGHRFLGMLDEIYATEAPRANARKSGLFGRFRRRSSAH
jgi:hypothetical protein